VLLPAIRFSAPACKSVYPNFSQEAANRTQTVHGEPNVVQGNLSQLRKTMEPRAAKSFIPIYPNKWPTVPKPSKDQVFMRGFKGKGLPQLLDDPTTRRMLGDVDVQDASTIVTDDEEALEHAECDRWRGEKILEGKPASAWFGQDPSAPVSSNGK